MYDELQRVLRGAFPGTIEPDATVRNALPLAVLLYGAYNVIDVPIDVLTTETGDPLQTETGASLQIT